MYICYIDINQIKNNIYVKYPRQPSTCHKCGLRNHLSRDCKTPEEHYQNALDINIDLVDDSDDTDIEIQVEFLQNNNTYKCSNCSYTCSTEDNLKAHMSSHNGEKPYQCNICVASFRDKKELDEHTKIHASHSGIKSSQHLNSDTKTGEVKDNLTSVEIHNQSNNKKDDDKIRQCTVCAYRCKKGVDLDKHLLTHKDEKPFKCNKCDDSFDSRINLDFHMENHSDVTVIDLSYASIVNSPVRHWTSSNLLQSPSSSNINCT